MQVLCLLGSPRLNGNSSAIAKRFCETAEDLGAQVQTFALNQLTYKGCQACMTCKTELDRCVLQDDLTPVLDAVYDTDLLVMASPVYFGEVSSQLKGFIDRTYSFLLPDYPTNLRPCRLPAGKKLLFIQTQGQPDTNQFNDIFPRYEYFFKWYGFKDNQLIRACGVMDKDDAAGRSDVMASAEKTANDLILP
jgi:multimeric flavodoxin WrbA